MDKKSIHVSKTFAELQKLTEVKLELPNVKASCRCLDKLFEEFEKSDLDKDEELAYIFIMRYLTMFTESRKTFKNDKKYIEALNNAKRINMAFEKASDLQASLKLRYELEKDNRTEEKTQESKAIVAEQPSTITDHSGSAKKGFVTAEELYRYVKSSEKFLIVDGRPSKEFSSCHIDYSCIVNIPADELRPGCSIVEVNKLLQRHNNPAAMELWNRRKSFSFLVLLFWSDDSSTVERVDLLKNAILKFDAEYSVKDLRLLERGLFSFSTCYPTLMTDPRYKGPTNSIDADDIIAPDNIHYPDWDLIEMDKETRRNKNGMKVDDGKLIVEEQNKIDDIGFEKDQFKSETNKNQVLNRCPDWIIDRSLKPSMTSVLNDSTVVDVVKPSRMLVDRSLKPSVTARNSTKNDLSLSSSSSVLTEIDINKIPEINTTNTKSLVEQNDRSSISSNSSDQMKKSIFRTAKNIDNEAANVVTRPINDNEKKNQNVEPNTATITTKKNDQRQNENHVSLKPKHEKEQNTIDDSDKASNVTFHENTRLSNNSRTDQDRTNFTAKGGAKSIPPPPSVGAGPGSDHSTTASNTPMDSSNLSKNLSQRVFQRIYDNNTDEYFIDRQNNAKRYQRVQPSEQQLFENSKENEVFRDQIVGLKDHHSTTITTNKSILKPSNVIGSALKRSTSQPNLTEDVNSSNKPPSVNKVDSTGTTMTTASTMNADLRPTHQPKSIPSSSQPLHPFASQAPQLAPLLDRGNKPNNYVAKFTEFSASRLNNFNPSYKTVTPGLTGLRNMGNTCYMNSVIQALSNTKFLSNYILTSNYRHDINRDNPLGYGGEIVTEYAFLIIALWNGNYREVSPSDFKHMIDCKNEMFRGTEQHDSQEFLLFLLDGLHEDLNRGSKHLKLAIPPIDDNDDQRQTDIDRAQHSWKTHVAVNDSVIVRLFQGQYRSKVTCDHCQMSSVTFDAFMYLSLPLVPNHNRCTLEDCLKLFLAEERMTGASQWFCPKCKTNRNARKKIDIWKLPPYLLIHLKRFSCSGQYREKLNTFVDFPMEMFSLVDILKHTKQSQKHDTYHLYAVSNHHGNMESGHYTSFCKNFKEDEWYSYDDDIVTRVSDVKTPSAYILFYESYNLKQAGFKK